MTQREDSRHRMGLSGFALLMPLLLAVGTPDAVAQDMGDPGAGHELAQTWCSSCHIVDRGEQSGVSSGVPTFIAIARMPSATPMSLRTFLLTRHGQMPDLHLSRDEIDDLTGYILSLRRQ